MRPDHDGYAALIGQPTPPNNSSPVTTSATTFDRLQRDVVQVRARPLVPFAGRTGQHGIRAPAQRGPNREQPAPPARRPRPRRPPTGAGRGLRTVQPGGDHQSENHPQVLSAAREHQPTDSEAQRQRHPGARNFKAAPPGTRSASTMPNHRNTAGHRDRPRHVHAVSPASGPRSRTRDLGSLLPVGCITGAEWFDDRSRGDTESAGRTPADCGAS